MANWVSEVQGERLAAERRLAEAQPSPTMSATEFAHVIEELGDLRPVLATADPLLKAQVYGDLGIRMTYRPADDIVAVSAFPMLSKVRVGGAIDTKVHGSSEPS